MPLLRSASSPIASVATALALVACASSPAGPTYRDVFAYCAAVRDVDAPDPRYVGPEVPAAVVRATGLRAYAPDAYRVAWRCMEGRVLACSPGADVPCLEKANVERAPTEETIAYCEQHPSEAFVPPNATARATVYAWKCSMGKPEIGGVFDEPDARGFLRSVWTEVPAE